jgi:hypothetical protein
MELKIRNNLVEIRTVLLSTAAVVGLAIYFLDAYRKLR